MGIFRLLLVVAVIWLIVLVVRRLLAGQRAAPRAREVSTVRCARCGVHLPEREAVRRQGRVYCSMEHGNLGPRDD